MVLAKKEKTERMKKQPAPAQSKKTPAQGSRPATQPGQAQESRSTAKPVYAHGNKAAVPAQGSKPATPAAQVHGNKAAVQGSAREEITAPLQPEAHKKLNFWSAEQRRPYFFILQA